MSAMSTMPTKARKGSHRLSEQEGVKQLQLHLLWIESDTFAVALGSATALLYHRSPLGPLSFYRRKHDLGAFEVEPHTLGLCE
jgi:hypothetical protein